MTNNYTAYLAAWRHALTLLPNARGHYPVPEPPPSREPPPRRRVVCIRSPRSIRRRAMRSRDVGPALTWRGQRGN